MKFRKFNSIENVTRQKFIDIILQLGIQCDWYVSEKVHGANFAFICDNNGIQCAKRSGIIGEGEKFFNHQYVKDKYASTITGIYELLKCAKDCNHLVIFGELYGGNIQKGIYYREDQDFYSNNNHSTRL